ncbi:TPA: nicotinic acetylcholine receptor subunit beta [Kluyvera ascorbata]|nr:nicotinic acetylcholine receptor subunit beta [Kluyvera ascorbata]
MIYDIDYQHPAVCEAEALLSRPQAYPESFTIAERTSERMERARNGLAHVLSNLLPAVEGEQKEEIYHWLSAVLTIVEVTKIDAEGGV